MKYLNILDLEVLTC